MTYQIAFSPYFFHFLIWKFGVNDYLCTRKTENASLAQLARARDL